MPNIYKFNIGNDFVAKASHAIEAFIEEQGEKSLRIALSGGSSPKAVYEKLAKSETIDWSRIELFQVDERYLPIDSDNLNAKLIRDSLTSKIPELKAFHTMDTSQTIEKTRADYEKKILKLNRPFFDLVLLGLGTDGHTASLFPNGPELEEVEKMVVSSKSPIPPINRLSLTYPAIMSSQKIIFLVRGANKKEIVKKWLKEDSDTEEIPARVILNHSDVDIFYDYSN